VKNWDGSKLPPKVDTDDGKVYSPLPHIKI